MSKNESYVSVRTKGKTLWAWAIATAFGMGYGKPGPGTWGASAAVLLWISAIWSLHPTPVMLQLILVGGIVLSIASGVPAAGIVARESGRRDPDFVVIDEVSGQWIALVGCRGDWRHALLALALFRFFDIIKPFPARQMEDLPRGWGIIFDDVAAGLYASVTGFLFSLWFS
jgi:phosphatidylglycerophosphatase A